jgi:hypothetical protein
MSERDPSCPGGFGAPADGSAPSGFGADADPHHFRDAATQAGPDAAGEAANGCPFPGFGSAGEEGEARPYHDAHDELSLATRQRVLDALSLIALSDVLPTLRPDLEPENAAFQMCRTWFDEVYVPGTRYMHGIKGDRDPERAETFAGAFSEDENRWLERFNRFLELRVDRNGSSAREEGMFPAGEPWRAVIKDAGYLVELLGGNPREAESRLTGSLAALLKPAGD